MQQYSVSLTMFLFIVYRLYILNSSSGKMCKNNQRSLKLECIVGRRPCRLQITEGHQINRETHREEMKTWRHWMIVLIYLYFSNILIFNLVYCMSSNCDLTAHTIHFQRLNCCIYVACMLWLLLLFLLL